MNVTEYPPYALTYKFYTMKNIAVQIKRIIFAVVFAGTISACSSDDDVKEIFLDREWNLTYINDGGVKIFTKDKIYSVTFLDNGFKVAAPGGVGISGKWKADGGTHEFRCSDIRTSGNIQGDTIATKMLQIFTNAKKYSGDTNWLQIKQQDNVFMQFYNNNE